LVLLVGIFLAIVAFVLIAVLLGGGGGGGGTVRQSEAPTTVAIVVAAQDIDLGATIQAADVSTKDVPVDQRPSDSFTDTSFVVGQIARMKVTSGQYISRSVFTAGGGINNIQVPAGLVGISVQVDQISGVGTIVKPGDFVDVISGFTGPDSVPLVIPNPSTAPALPSRTSASMTRCTTTRPSRYWRRASRSWGRSSPRPSRPPKANRLLPVEPVAAQPRSTASSRS